MKIREIDFNKNIIDNIKKDNSNNNKIFKEHNIKITENIYFNDDYWDFNNKNTLNKKMDLYRYDFSEIDYRYKYYLKKIILDALIIQKKSASTVKGYFSVGKKFISYLQDKCIYNFNRITKNIVEDYFFNKDWSESTKKIYKFSILTFLSEVEISNKELDYSNVYKYLHDRDYTKILAQTEANKTKIIPDHIFDSMISLALKEIHANKVSEKDIYIACMIIILGETGMRISEFLHLEKDKVHELKIDEKHTINCLKFITYKIVPNKNSEYRWTETYLTDKAKLAYDTMNKLSVNKESKYVFYGKASNLKPCDDDVARYYILRFILRHYEDLSLNKPHNETELNTIKLTKHHIIGKEFKDMIGKEVYTITPHQFRVTVCTRLYKNGVPLEFIRQHMNHLSEDMTCHYIRMKETKEKKLQAIKLFKLKVKSNSKFLKTDEEKENLREEYKAINDFIKKDKLNIFGDIDQIINLLMKSDTPLTETPQGYCYHPKNVLGRLCERQEYISSLNYIEPYLPSIEYVDITYDIFKDKVKIVQNNKKVADKKPKYKEEYIRELKSLKYFIDKRFLPEIQLIKDEVTIRGIEQTIRNYPNVKDIILNIDNIIYKEINIWMQ